MAKSNSAFLCHMLLYNSVQLRPAKVLFPGQERPQMGVIARKTMGQGTLLTELFGILSLDIVKGANVSSISSHPSQQVPKGTRLMAGPARFVNHSCKPNASVRISLVHDLSDAVSQLYPMFGVPIMVVRLLEEVSAGEEITVSYGESYWLNSTCLCCRCTGSLAQYRPLN